jgi:putative cell wall-binding protein
LWDASNQIVRTWGQLALDTAVAISRFNWPDKDSTDPDWPKAQAVVISRSDVFYDALAGSALAANKSAPLLITPPTSLYTGAASA